MECPDCNLVNPPTAARCDCGYVFGPPTMHQADVSGRDRQHLKKGIASVLKAGAGIAAGLVCLMAPVTGVGILVSMVALIVAIIMGVLGETRVLAVRFRRGHI